MQMTNSNVVALIHELDKTASLLEEAASVIDAEPVSKVASEFNSNLGALAFLDGLCTSIGVE